jgi:hypothetical protein
MLIDFHTHVFPDALAPRAITSLAKQANIPYYTDGTLCGLKSEMARTHTDISVILPVATTEHHTPSVNAFAAECGRSEGIIAFGSVYPFSADAVEILSGFKERGLFGGKATPRISKFLRRRSPRFPYLRRLRGVGLANRIPRWH